MNAPAGSLATLALTPRDSTLLDALSRKLSIMSFEQVRRGWWPECGAPAACTRRVRRLETMGLVSRERFVVPLITPLRGPLVVWLPGEERPDFGPAIREGRRRGAAPRRPCVALRATPLGAARVGATALPLRDCDVAHDLVLAEVFLWMAHHAPALAASWTAVRHARDRRAERVADAVISRPGSPLHLEVVGSSYTRTKLVLVHRHCESRGQEYQLW